MSKITDESLRPHLTALVDGELEPLEAIALQQRLRQSPQLAEECRELERLKVAVHLAGNKDRAPEPLGRALENMCRAHFEREAKADSRRRWLRWLPLGVAVPALAGLAIVVGTGGADTGEGAQVATGGSVAPVAVDPSDRVLARLVDFHREHGSPMTLGDLAASGALVTVERLPDSFIAPEGQRPQLVQASYMGCNEREGGSTLAVLRVERVDLPTRIDNALETTGVYVDTIEGVQVRVSVSGDKLFVLLSGEGSGKPSPI